MNTENKVLMLNAKQALNGKWGVAIGATLLTNFFIFAASLLGSRVPIPLIGGVLVLVFVTAPLSLGSVYFFLNLSRNKPVRIADLFVGYDRLTLIANAVIRMWLFTFLWSLLFIIPGIIASLSYSQTLYILADEENVKEASFASSAISRSKQMMRGNKWKFFKLGLRFIALLLIPLAIMVALIMLWGVIASVLGAIGNGVPSAISSILGLAMVLLVIIWIGLLVFWITPYMATTYAKFYDDIKKGVTQHPVEAGPSQQQSTSTENTAV